MIELITSLAALNVITFLNVRSSIRRRHLLDDDNEDDYDKERGFSGKPNENHSQTNGYYVYKSPARLGSKNTQREIDEALSRAVSAG